MRILDCLRFRLGLIPEGLQEQDKFGFNHFCIDGPRKYGAFDLEFID